MKHNRYKVFTRPTMFVGVALLLAEGVLFSEVPLLRITVIANAGRPPIAQANALVSRLFASLALFGCL